MEQLSMTLIGTWYFMANDNKGSRHSPDLFLPPSNTEQIYKLRQ